MYVAGGRGDFGLQALARPMHSASQAIVDIWIFVSTGSPRFYSNIPQPDACLGIRPTMAHCTSFVCMEFGPAQVESDDGHFFFIPATNWGLSFLFSYSGSALQVDRLEPSPSAKWLCWHHF